MKIKKYISSNLARFKQWILSIVTSRSSNMFSETEVRHIIMEFRKDMNDNMNKREENWIGFTETSDWLRNRLNDL